MAISTPYLQDSQGNKFYFPPKFFIRTEAITRRTNLIQLPQSDVSREIGDRRFNPRRVDITGIYFTEDAEEAREFLDDINSFANKSGLELWDKGRRLKIDKMVEASIADVGKVGYLYNVSIGFVAYDPFWYSEEKEEILNFGLYGYKITIDTSPLQNDLSDHPFKVVFTNDEYLAARCREDGNDVRFFDSDGETPLDFERLTWSVASGKVNGEFYVLIPSIPAAGKFIYCFFGNPAWTEDVSTTGINPDILDDGDFEQWTSSTNLTYWNENVSGSSSVNRESIEKVRGNYAVRFDVDESESVVAIYQNILSKIDNNKKYKLCILEKSNLNGKTAYFYLLATGVMLYYNFNTHVWQSSATSIYISSYPNYQLFSNYYNGYIPEEATQIRLYLNRGASASSSLYFDDVHIFKADSYEACDFIANNWYNQGNLQTHEIYGQPELQVGGTADTFPVITLTMLDAGNSFSLNINGLECSLTQSLEAGDVVEIDCYNGTVKVNGNNAIAYFSGVFPRLLGGKENTIDYEGPAASLNIKYSEAYI